MSSCPNCGHENEPEGRFCSRCGTPLTRTVAPARTERKVVTVLFADLVGFTARGEQLDPEDVQAVLSPYHARLRSELERWGGTVEKFIGDAVMALFGAPVARENDPERAVRAGLAIRDWIAEEGKLQVRIAVNTGEALVNLDARPEAGEGMAAGDVVNTAARLQSAAPVNGILVGETTYRATAQTIDYRDAPAVSAKGKETPIPVREVVQARARFGVDLAAQGRAPLVGRERELEQLKGALTRARLQRSPELVTLVGVPGIGKSRLVAELFASIERGEQDSRLIYWRQGRSLPYGEGVSYWALAEMVKAHVGILESDGADEADAKLGRALAGLIDEDAEWVRSHLRRLVGQATELPDGSREEAFAAWRRFFEALAEEHPLVLVFEDVQWADEGMLEFIEHLVDWARGVPILVLCTARLELLERRPAWGGGTLNAATIALAPLSEDETAELISRLSERPLLPAETQTALLDHAGGNPLYAEQYVRMLEERSAAPDLALPETVQGIIAARLDALPAEEKALLQDAAVIGKVFWLGGLAKERDEVEQRLHALERKDFVQRAKRSSVAGETEFAFKHVLLRDVAYGQIPRSERAEKHRLAAEWIESLGRPEDHAEMVAHHYLSALELMRAAGRDVGPIAEPARVALREAGDRAGALNAFDSAERYYGEALALRVEDGRERYQLLLSLGRVRYRRADSGAPELAEARDGFLTEGDCEAAAEAALMLADIAWNEGRREGVVPNLDDARSFVAGGPPSRIRATVLSEAARYDMLADRNDSAIEVGREAVRMAEQLGLDDIRAHALNNIGAARVAAGDAGGIDDLRESIEIATRLDSVADRIRGHNNLGTMNVVLGRLDEARTDVLEAHRLAEHFGHYGFARWSAGGPMLGTAYQVGGWDEVVAGANAFLDDVGSTPHYQQATAYGLRGLIRLGRDDSAGAESDADRSVESARPAMDPQILLPTLAMASHVFFALDEEARACGLLDEALGEFRELRGGAGFAVVWTHALAWVGSMLGRGDEFLDVFRNEPLESPWLRAARAVAADDLSGAADVFDDIGASTFVAFYRLRAAERLLAEGRRAEADVQLAPALPFYRSVGATRYVREGEALLAASA
jgi:class 3 adenylate cyclase